MKNFTLKIFVLTILFGSFVFAGSPIWVGYNYGYNITENSEYHHDLRNNISNYEPNITFSFDTPPQNITWVNSSGTFTDVLPEDVSDWIFLQESDKHDLVINASTDNQTGRFSIPLQALNRSDNTTSGVLFEFFYVYAINDAPWFINLADEYNLSQNNLFSETIDATDEEGFYPLSFNLTFINNCTHADWSGRNEGENCTLFNLTQLSSTSTLMNFTPSSDDVGEYWAWFSVSDFGENYTCPHAYCDNATYEQNKTSQIYLIKFNIFSSLEINVSNCTGASLNEGVPFNCSIYIKTTGESDNLNISSYASFADGYAGAISNHSWFYGGESSYSANFSKRVNISLVPGKKEVGNWTINFSVFDSTRNQSGVEQIKIFVNWNESNVFLDNIPNYTIYENTTFDVIGRDDDLLIQHKPTKNEVLTFDSNESWVFVTGTETFSGNNFTTAHFKINFDAVESYGNANYSVKINVSDSAGNFDEQIFVIEVLTDNKAQWNSTDDYVFVLNENDSFYASLTDGYVYDPDNDSLTFSYTNTTEFKHFSLTSGGIINFSTDDYDVGEHILEINASDGKRESIHRFNFTIINSVDAPIIKPFSSPIDATEGVFKQISMDVSDDDFLIPDSQSAFYHENLSVNVTITNLTAVVTPISFDFYLSIVSGNLSIFLTNFTPEGDNVGEYNVSVNVSDAGGESDVDSFILNISAVNDPPNLSYIENYSLTILDNFYVDINATDEEDSPVLPENGNLTYWIENLTEGGDFLEINSTTGVINFSLNESYAGFWEYNVSVNDTDGAVDSQIFSLAIYGYSNISCPASSYIFNWTEGVPTGNLDFCVNYAVNNTLLVYKFYMDRIVYSDPINYNYTSLFLNNSLRNATNYTWTSSANFSLNFTPDYWDESYGMFKNFSLVVYNPDYPDLNDSIIWRVNISHSNQPLVFKDGAHIPDRGPVNVGTPITINLSEYFEDADHFDKKINQTVNFTLSSQSAGYIVAASSFNDWILTLNSPAETTEILTVHGYEYDNSNNLLRNVSSNSFQVEYVTSNGSSSSGSSGGGGGGGGGGTSTLLKHFSLKLIFPENITLTEGGSIEVPFKVINTGQMDLSGIYLTSSILFNYHFSDDISISLGESYIPSLGIGQSRSYKMTINAKKNKAGRYKATVYANVTSPKFSDWGDFYIELMRTNETEANQYLIFTEKIIAENPECLELTESLNEAKKAFKGGNFSDSLKMSKEVIRACEESIKSNEQIKYPLKFIKDNVYYLLFSTLAVFLAGFIFYVYKRVRFNKSEIIEGYGGDKRL